MRNKKIAFFGYKNSFDFDKIGGTDAFIRRLSNSLKKDYEIFLIHYDMRGNSSILISNNISQLYFLKFNDALSFIKKNNIIHTICIYLKPIDRLKLFQFHNLNNKLIFHSLISVYNRNIFKRGILFLESTITYNGNIYCISNRIFQSIKSISQKPVLLLPPVDDSFFKFNKLKSKQRKKVRVAYMGRLDYGKGADLALKFFLNSKLDTNKYEFYMYTYPWENDSFSMRLHNKLSNQNEIKYVQSKLYDDPKRVTSYLKKIIDDTDIFYLPYRYMHSTIDTPLVPLEILARNKKFITTNINGISHLAFHEDLLLNKNQLSDYELITDRIIKVLKKSYEIDSFVDKLNFKTSNISKLLIESIKNG